MFLKLIVCQTSDRPRFTAGQQAWRALAGIPGFIGQLGGWSIANANEAVILSAWLDGDAYGRFMADGHAAIVGASGQASLLTTVQVTCFEQDMAVAGRFADLAALMTALAADRPLADPCIRLVDCVVHPAARDGFRQVQHELWNPALAANGVLAGAFSGSVDDPNRFLTASVWGSASDHDAYNRHAVPQLMRQADVISACRAIAGRIVVADPAWSVGRNEKVRR
jgi:quinol monooxygenase YgiN